jgi:hypothetical protein
VIFATVLSLLLLTVAGVCLHFWLKPTRGLEALHSGMRRSDVIQALGAPDAVFDCHESGCKDVAFTGNNLPYLPTQSDPWGIAYEETALVYKTGPTPLMVVGFTETGILRKRESFDFAGPQSPAMQLAAENESQNLNSHMTMMNYSRTEKVSPTSVFEYQVTGPTKPPPADLGELGPKR